MSAVDAELALLPLNVQLLASLVFPRPISTDMTRQLINVIDFGLVELVITMVLSAPNQRRGRMVTVNGASTPDNVQEYTFIRWDSQDGKELWRRVSVIECNNGRRLVAVSLLQSPGASSRGGRRRR